MARPRTTDIHRSKAKAAALEDIARGMKKLAEIAATVEDCTKEGFPYRDGARAKAELQLHETIGKHFGEQSEEFLIHQRHVVQVASLAEAQITLDLIKSLSDALERKKTALQQGTSAVPEIPTPATPLMTLVPPISVDRRESSPQPSSPHTREPATSPIWPPTHIQFDQSPIHPRVQAAATRPAPAAVPATATPSPVTAPALAPPPAPSQPVQPAPQPDAVHPAPVTPPRPTTQPTLQPAPQAAPPPATSESRAPVSPEHHPGSSDPLAPLRTLCTRFHAVVRQLRLRKDYRPTLEVDDDLDLQDLLAALLKVNWEELGSEEWTPAYAQDTARTAFLLDQDRIVLIAYKTRPGLPAKDLAERITADTNHFASRNRHTHLVCFVYDPDGRIGTPRRFETDLTSISDRFTCDVLVAPQT